MLLINPQFNREQKLGPFERYIPVSLPLPLGTLSSYLILKGKKAKILDEQVTPINRETVSERLKDLEKPYIFGLSCTTAAINRGLQIAEMLKEWYPDCFVIIGGIHPTVLPEEVLQNKNIDIAVKREGEEILNQLYDAIKNGKDYSKIKGISFKDKNGKIIHNELAPLFEDLDLLPQFPYHMFEDHLDRYDLGIIMSARGCPYNCIFCSQKRISGGKYRFKSPEKVMEELDLLINKYKIKRIVFFDDNFVINRKRSIEVCKRIVEKGFHKKARFVCQTRGDAIDEEILQNLKNAGFDVISIGIETTNERLLKLVNKGETVDDNLKAAFLIKKFGFKLESSILLGLPTETKEERREVIKKVLSLPLDFVRFNNATPYPGTKLYEIVIEEKNSGGNKNVRIAKDWSNLNACSSFVGIGNASSLAYAPIGTSFEELNNDILKANLSFWLKPKRLLNVLTAADETGGWFKLPEKWYLKPKEIFDMARLGVMILKAYSKILLLRW